MDTVVTPFDGFLDDAALFPPGSAPMDLAVAAHLARVASPEGRLVGPFVCPADRLDELATELGGRGTLDVAVVADGPFPAGLPGLRVVAIETRRPDAVVVPPGARLVVEVPLDDVDAAPAGALVKLRTGGPAPEAIPSPEALAAALGRLVRADRPFKLTAGLHHGLRHVDPATGLEHHGFVDVLLAVALLLGGASDAAAEVALSRRDDLVGPDLLALGDLAAVRRLFTSFGTCDLDTPIHDLRALGLLERTAA